MAVPVLLGFLSTGHSISDGAQFLFLHLWNLFIFLMSPVSAARMLGSGDSTLADVLT